VSAPRPAGDHRLVESFLEAIASERGAARNTLEAYRRDLCDYADFLAAHGASALEASSADVRAFIAARGAAGLAAASLARRLSAVRQFHKYLYVEGRRGDDPTLAIEGPRRARPLPKILSVAEVDRLIAVAREGLEASERPPRERLAVARMACLIELIYASGLRVSELVALPKSAARAKQPLIAVRGKGGKERLAPISAPAGAAMKVYRDLLGGHRHGAGQPARAAPRLRQPPLAERRRPARGAGAARPRRHFDDANLHPRARRTRQGDGARPAPVERRETAMSDAPWRATPDGVVIACRLTPKGGRDAIDGVATLANGTRVLLVRVRSAPEDGKANEALCRLIAETLGVAASKARLVAGAKSRLKQVAATGEAGELMGRLSDLTRGAPFSGAKA
jgi:integrase/recombinase XerD